ncbi:MAG: hypothetical protein ACOYD6_06765 [Limnochordia bacterium]
MAVHLSSSTRVGFYQDKRGQSTKADNSQRNKPASFESILKEQLRLPEAPEVHFRRLQKYIVQVRKLLKDKGLALQGECSFSIGTDGKLFIDGSAADVEKVRSILDSHGELGENLRNEIVFYGFAQRLQKSLEFQKAYQQDPKAAVARYSYLFRDSYSIDVLLTMMEDAVKVDVLERRF